MHHASDQPTRLKMLSPQDWLGTRTVRRSWFLAPLKMAHRVDSNGALDNNRFDLKLIAFFAAVGLFCGGEYEPLVLRRWLAVVERLVTSHYQRHFKGIHKESSLVLYSQ